MGIKINFKNPKALLGFALFALSVVIIIIVLLLYRLSNQPPQGSLLNTTSATPSPLIWGTNLSMDNSQDQFLTNAGAAPALQALHANLVRMPIRDNLTANDYTTALTKIKQIGATPLLIVHGAVYSGGDPYPVNSVLLQIAKNIFPTQTVYVDAGNEEDLGGASVSTYVSGKYGWNVEIPKYKQLTGPNFKYGGPVNYQYDRAYIDSFVSTANPAPDYIVWHAYAGSCGNNRPQDTQASMLASIDNWGAHIQEISGDFATLSGGAHKGLPIIIDEWNYASDLGVGKSASPCYSADQNFINQFFTKAFNMFISSQQYGLIGTAEYEAFVGKDEQMLDGSNKPTLQGQTFQANYESAIGKLPQPPTPQPGAPTYACSALAASLDPTIQNDYHFLATGQVSNGATVLNANFDFGDGTIATSLAPASGQTTIAAEHKYSGPGTYTVIATVNFSVNGSTQSATCTTQVVIAQNPTSQTYQCSSLNASQDSTILTDFHFTATAKVSGGAILTNGNFAYGDGSSSGVITAGSGQNILAAEHDYGTQSGTKTITATLTFRLPSSSQTAQCTTQITVPASNMSGTTKITAQDTFKRSDQNHWGSASDGQQWTGDADGSSAFSIKNNVGVISGGSVSYSAIIGPSTTNAQIVFTGRINNFTNSNFGGLLRYKDDNNWYKAYLTDDQLVIQKRVNSNYTILKSVSFSAKTNTNYTVRFQAIGSDLSAKVWPSSNNEPDAWTATVSDSSFSSGYSGLRALPQSGVVVNYYNYTAYQL